MHLCLFDIDGTLLLTGGAAVRPFEATFAEDFDVPDINGTVSFAGRSDRAIATDLFRAHGITPSADAWNRFRNGYIARVERALPKFAGQVLPGVGGLLGELARRSEVVVGLVTGNVQQTARLKLTHYGLWDHFSFGGFGDEHIDRNDIAATALANAREHAHRNDARIDGAVVVIGDTPNDVRCARSIGAHAVAVATGQTDLDTLRACQPDLLLESLVDYAEILQIFDT